MDKIKLDILALSSSQSHVGHYALLLGETEGRRRLPIIIGTNEAQAIALEIENIKTERPMTHDLIFDILTHFRVPLKEIVINKLSEGIFFAKLILDDGTNTHEIDSRPSDAVALSVRFKVPIFTYEDVLSEAGIVISEEDEAEILMEDMDDDEDFLQKIEQSDPIEDEHGAGTPQRSTTMPDQIRVLNEKLSNALSQEDYELAAQIRDKINKLKED